MAKFTIHRLLSLKKSTEERINDILCKTQFVAYKQGQKDNINGVPVKKVEECIRTDYQKVNDLISNYIKLKSALLSSNAGIQNTTEVKKVTVDGKEYTMAELIFVSDEIYGNNKHKSAFKSKLLNKLKQDYSVVLSRIENQNNRIEADIKDYLNKASASDKTLSAEDIKKRSEIFHADGDYIMVDPLNIKEVIDKLEAEIKAFKTDCDATISENNALTTVELDLTSTD